MNKLKEFNFTLLQLEPDNRLHMIVLLNLHDV